VAYSGRRRGRKTAGVAVYGGDAYTAPPTYAAALAHAPAPTCSARAARAYARIPDIPRGTACRLTAAEAQWAEVVSVAGRYRAALG